MNLTNEKWDGGDGSSLDTAPTCKGFGMHHKVKSMVCIGLEDDGAVIWRCPKCLYVWSANADRPDTVGQA